MVDLDNAGTAGITPTLPQCSETIPREILRGHPTSGLFAVASHASPGAIHSRVGRWSPWRMTNVRKQGCAYISGEWSPNFT